MIVGARDQRVAVKSHRRRSICVASTGANPVLGSCRAPGSRRRGQALEQLTFRADVDRKREGNRDRFERAFTLHALASSFAPGDPHGLAVKTLGAAWAAGTRGTAARITKITDLRIGLFSPICSLKISGPVKCDYDLR